MSSTAAAVLRAEIESALETRIPSALTVRSTTAPEVIKTGIPELDEIGIPRGGLTEICGPDSSGRTTLLLSLMRQVTQQGECCALIDVSNSFDPISAADNDVNLNRLYCVRCTGPHPKLTQVDKALVATDWIIHAGGFGLIALDLSDIPARVTSRIPMTWWYRFRRGIELISASLVIIERQPFAKSCASLVIDLQPGNSEWVSSCGRPQNPKLLTGANFIADVTRSRVSTFQRKSPGKALSPFRVATSWAG